MPEPLIDDQLDPSFRVQISQEKGGEKITRCFACATCTLSCPVRAVDDEFNPRRIIHLALLGAKREVLESGFVWLCSSCYLCSERCPQDVSVTELMCAIRNIAVREGQIPAGYVAQLELLDQHGRLYEIGDFENKKRTKMGLPTLEEKREEVARILELVGATRYYRKQPTP